MKRTGLALLMILMASACSTTSPRAEISDAETQRLSDAEIQRLETAKWNPSTLGREEFMRMFAEDFVSVEYGTDVQGGVHRKTRADVFSAPPLPPAEFALSDWRFIHADPHVFVVSYRATGVSFPWEAYATSVWVRREGRWQTVFYQASTAKEEKK